MAALGVAVLVVALIALRQPKQTATQAGPTSAAGGSSPASSGGHSSASSGGSPSASHATSGSAGSGTGSASTAAIGSQPLIVLNNTTTTGLAAQAARRFERGGWTVTSYGNLTNTILSTAAYYDPSIAGAKQAAEALQAQYPTIKRVVPRFPELPAGPVIVVLTPDYSAG